MGATLSWSKGPFYRYLAIAGRRALKDEPRSALQPGEGKLRSLRPSQLEDHAVLVLDPLSAGTCLKELQPHRAPVTFLRWNPGLKRNPQSIPPVLLSADLAGEVRAWHITSGDDWSCETVIRRNPTLVPPVALEWIKGAASLGAAVSMPNFIMLDAFGVVRDSLRFGIQGVWKPRAHGRIDPSRDTSDHVSHLNWHLSHSFEIFCLTLYL